MSTVPSIDLATAVPQADSLKARLLAGEFGDVTDRPANTYQPPTIEQRRDRVARGCIDAAHMVRTNQPPTLRGWFRIDNLGYHALVRVGVKSIPIVDGHREVNTGTPEATEAFFKAAAVAIQNGEYDTEILAARLKRPGRPDDQ